MIRYFAPPKQMANYISSYWCIDSIHQLPPISPGTGAELIFYTNASLSSLVIPRFQPFIFEPVDMQLLSVRIRHNALHALIPIPIHEIADKKLSAADIWGKQGKLLELMLVDNIPITEKIKLLNNFLLNQFINKKTPDWLESALNILYDQKLDNNLDSAIAHSGKSVRQFQNIIKYNTGVSAKYFQRTARFQHTLRALLTIPEQQKSVLDIALQYRYYDQAHFIKDFKSFTGVTPSQYFSAEQANYIDFRKQYYVPSFTNSMISF